LGRYTEPLLRVYAQAREAEAVRGAGGWKPRLGDAAAPSARLRGLAATTSSAQADDWP